MLDPIPTANQRDQDAVIIANIRKQHCPTVGSIKACARIEKNLLGIADALREQAQQQETDHCSLPTDHLAGKTAIITKGEHRGQKVKILTSLTRDQSILCKFPWGQEISLYPGLNCGIPIPLQKSKKLTPKNLEKAARKNLIPSQ